MKQQFVPLALAIIILTTSYSDVLAQRSQPVASSRVTWSADGTRLSVRNDDGLRILDENFEVIQFKSNAEAGMRLSGTLSPDGQKINVGHEVWDANTLEVLWTWDGIWGLGRWNSDGSQISTLSDDNKSILILDGNSGQVLKMVSNGGYQIEFALWSPDDTKFVFYIASVILVFDIASDNVSRYDQPGYVNYLIWSPDSTRLAYTTSIEVEPGTPGSIQSLRPDVAYLNSVNLIDVNTGELIQSIDSPNTSGMAATLAWSPDGALLVGVDIDLNRSVYVWDANTGEMVDSFVTDEPVNQVSFSPYNGRMLLATGAFRQRFDNNQPQPITAQSEVSQEYLNGTLQVAVPVPSLEKLQAISEQCIANPGAEAALAPQIAADQLDAFTAQVEALSAQADPAIPPGCAADLIAVAEALQSEQ
jgi:Tol biopolymer transport system component